MRRCFELGMLCLMISVVVAPSLVLADCPGWSVNPAEYQNTGSVTSAVYRDLADVGSAGDKLGAFHGAECRGVVDALQTPGMNYVFPVTVYSNAASGESLSFRYYDSALRVVYLIDEKVEFVADMIVGSAISPMQMNTGGCGPFCPSVPVPCDLCQQDSVETLSWNGGDPDAGDSVVYYVYLGTEADPPIYDTTEVYDGSVTEILYSIAAPLADGSTYNWRIVAEDRLGIAISGPVWTFQNTPGAIEPTLWGRIKLLYD